jgi:hypothetical protein
MGVVFGKKKKLPLPTTGVFACENSEQVRPRVVAGDAP